MSFHEKSEEIVIQLNEQFTELLEDTYDFSKDIMIGISLMPFAIGFFILIGIIYGYYSFILTNTGFFSKIFDTMVLAILFFGVIRLSRRYLELKRKYSTLFDLMKKMDKLKES